MIVDFHCHILPPAFRARHQELVERDKTYATLFPEPGASLATADTLLEAMNTDGVDCSVVMGFGWTDPEIAREANDYVIRAVQRSGKRLAGFCSVNPAWGTAALLEIERCAALGMKGIGELHPDSQGFDITSRDELAPLMDLARPLGLPVLIHTSEPVGHQYPGKGETTPDRVYRLIRNFPQNIIICAHWGGGLPFYGLMPELPGELRNVYFDTAASPFLYSKEIFEVASKTIGYEKVLFGTDYPLISHSRLIAQVAECNLDQDSRTAIMGGNAAALLGLTWEATSPTGDHPSFGISRE